MILILFQSGNFWQQKHLFSQFYHQCKNEIVPIEVKAAENLQAKSLRAFVEKNSPKMAIRTSMSDFREETWLTNLPLYAINELTNYMEGRS